MVTTEADMEHMEAKVHLAQAAKLAKKWTSKAKLRLTKKDAAIDKAHSIAQIDQIKATKRQLEEDVETLDETVMLLREELRDSQAEHFSEVAVLRGEMDEANQRHDREKAEAAARITEALEYEKLAHDLQQVYPSLSTQLCPQRHASIPPPTNTPRAEAPAITRPHTHQHYSATHTGGRLSM